MGLPRQEAAARLSRGDAAFILAAGVSRMGELRKLDHRAPFYAGLLVESLDEPGAAERAAGLYEAALNSPSPRLRDAAARKLLAILLGSGDTRRAKRIVRLMGAINPAAGSSCAVLRDASLYALGRFSGLPASNRAALSPWEAAFSLAASLRVGGKDDSSGIPAAEFLDFFLKRPVGEAYRWLYEQLKNSAASPFGPAELAALEGRLAVSRSAYEEALGHFRLVLAEDQALFFKYPELLGDLGRTFQYSSGQEDGAVLFAEWDRFLQEGNGPAASNPASPYLREIRYRLLFFAGRIEARRERYPLAAEFFARALPFAPDDLQRDACIWYILDLSPGSWKSLLETYIPLWHEPLYFEDILDRISRELTARRQWKTMADIFPLIRNKADRGSVAKYAYILGRAVAEGYIPAAEAGTAEELFRVALEENGPSFYYRTMAATRLGRPIPLPASPAIRARTEESPGNGETSPFPHAEEMEFFEGFFSFGAADFAYSYIQPEIDNLTIPELRVLAGAYRDAGMWRESIRIASVCLNRRDYVMRISDLYLLYPRPFRNLIEGNAGEAGVPAELLYGLIRTESAFVPGAGSRAGALGLTQLMTPTALEMAGRVRRQGGPDYIEDGTVNLRDPEINIHLGSYYLKYLIDRMENPLLAILAYNGGMGRVRRWRTAESRLPADLFLETIELRETREYGRKVLGAAVIYGYLYDGMTMEGLIADSIK